MVYLKSLRLLSDYQEHFIGIVEDVRRLDNSMYPLHIFPLMSLERVDFAPITIIHGGNGSGKSTLLNIIATKLEASRKSEFEKGLYFLEYVRQCKVEMDYTPPVEIKIITSDDVFDYLLDVRAINAGISRRKERLTKDYLENRYVEKDYDIEDYEMLRARSDALSKTRKEYTRERLSNLNITEHSNGEAALLFWEREIKDNSIYILDEPENSLSAENQMKLRKFIEDSARFYNCQFIISTHSPFLSSLTDNIYDLDKRPVGITPWSELSSTRIYYDFFKEHKNEFISEDK